MSKPPSFPMFVARTPSGSGCGHQHKQASGAIACAQATLNLVGRRGHSVKYMDVVQVSKKGGEKQVERVEAT